MSNVNLVLLGIFVSALGGGACTLALAILRQNRALAREVQFLGTAYNQVAESRDDLHFLLCAANTLIDRGEVEAIHLKSEVANLDANMWVKDRQIEELEAKIQALEASNRHLFVEADNGWRCFRHQEELTKKQQEKIENLEETIQALEAWIASPPQIPSTSSPFAENN